MGTYGLEGVIRAWKSGTLTTEQAIGQVLLLLEEVEKRIVELERWTTPPRPTPTLKSGRPKGKMRG